MTEKDEIIIHVQADKWIAAGHVWVVVSYRLWDHPKLAAGIAKAIEMTFSEKMKSKRITDCDECIPFENYRPNAHE